MIYIFWALLNMALALSILYICYLLVKQVAVRYGRALSIVFALVVLNIICGRGNSKTINWNKWQFYPDSGKLYKKDFTSAIIQNNPMFSINLGVSYFFREKGADPLPKEAFSFVNGTLSGVEWTPHNILLNTTGQQVLYEVDGSMGWSLLGTVVYREAKTFKGVLPYK